MATFSKKVMGKEVGDAKVYAKPHSMSGGPVKQAKVVDPNTLAGKSVNPSTPAMRVSVGDPGADNVKTDGIKIRGTGAATKGVISRGPMA
jgi:hypothetical protein